MKKKIMDNHFAKWGFGPGCYIVLPVLGPTLQEIL